MPASQAGRRGFDSRLPLQCFQQVAVDWSFLLFHFCSVKPASLYLIGLYRLHAQLDRITVDPTDCLGQPTVRGLRIAVTVLLKLLCGWQDCRRSPGSVPELEPEDVRPAIQYGAWVVSDRVLVVPAA
ncbi:MAG: DUF433 domain-containing protein [Acidobacteria bacterium]|nr:MAG: DUF433 domain-containing protein [Acidobacteriota bacterium]